MKQDGSPPLYYLALHLWIQAFGNSEGTTHALSLVFALLTVPVALWGARSLWGERAGWIAAGLFALNPFLTNYAQETRMYSLVVLCALPAVIGFLHVFVYDRRSYLPLFVGGLVAGLYTHNWTLFMGATMGAIWIVQMVLEHGRRAQLRRDGLIAFGAVGLLYAPWLPTLAFQAAHTGAPWSRRPTLQSLIDSPARLLGGEGPEMLLLLAAGTGLGLLLVRLRSRRGTPEARDGEAAAVLLALFVGTVLLAWLSSQASPAWANRYLAIGVAPLLLAGALGLASNRTRTAMVALVLVAIFWVSSDAPSSKSNTRVVMGELAHRLQPGDLVVSTQPELIPVLNYYLPPGLDYATLTGRVPDVGVTDWVDGVERLENTTVDEDLEPLIDALPQGKRVLLVSPMIINEARWQAPWTSLVRERTLRWRSALAGDDRFTVTALSPGSLFPVAPNPIRATIYEKTGVR